MQVGFLLNQMYRNHYLAAPSCTETKQENANNKLISSESLSDNRRY